MRRVVVPALSACVLALAACGEEERSAAPERGGTGTSRTPAPTGENHAPGERSPGP